jgi:hypothetical protein
MDFVPTKDNISETKAVVFSLLTNKEKLVEETSEYPLQIDFCNYRITVSNREDIEVLIQDLQSKVCSWYKENK